MVIEFGNWRIAPNRGRGCRCWEVYRGKATRAERFYDSLDRALLWCAEWDLRNKVEGDYDLAGALAEWERVCKMVTDACQAVGYGDGSPDGDLPRLVARRDG